MLRMIMDYISTKLQFSTIAIQGTQTPMMYILQFGSLTTMFDFSHGSCAADGEYEQSLGGTQFQLVPPHPPNPNAFAFSGTFSENQESSVGILPQPLQFDESVAQPTQPRKTQRSRLGIKT